MRVFISCMSWSGQRLGASGRVTVMPGPVEPRSESQNTFVMASYYRNLKHRLLVYSDFFSLVRSFSALVTSD